MILAQFDNKLRQESHRRVSAFGSAANTVEHHGCKRYVFQLGNALSKGITEVRKHHTVVFAVKFRGSGEVRGGYE